MAPRAQTTAPPSAAKRSILGMGGLILGLHLLGWGGVACLLSLASNPSHAGTLLGLCLTAYTLGMRHAFDADHIAAIDNITRKQLAEGERPVSVGFWFSLGHSTVVFSLVALLAVGVRSIADQLTEESSLTLQIAGTVGTIISGAFLVLVGVLNLIVLRGIVGMLRRLRDGSLHGSELEARLGQSGMASRLIRRATRAVTKPWHAYPLGLLFGLGFDTATEVGLLVVAAGAAVSLPWYAVLILPVVFAAAMSLLDTVDGLLMCYAYGWANLRPVRRVYYNLAITGLSVAVALVIGGIELASVLAQKLGIESGPLAAIARIELGYVGFIVVGLFALTWIVAIAIWQLGRIESRLGAP